MSNIIIAISVVLVIAAISVVLVLALIVQKRRSTPSVAMFQAIERAILDLQRVALRDVIPDQKGEVRGFDEEAARNSTRTLAETVRFVYTIEQRDRGFAHLISSQLKRPKGRKYQAGCMLIVMLVLNRQLGMGAIKQSEVKFEVNESEFGTQYVGMFLTDEQHNRFLAGLPAAA